MTETLATSQGGDTGRTLRDIALVLALIAVVVAVSAHGPSTTYTYAQLEQVGASVATVHAFAGDDPHRYGTWLLPRDQFGGWARKPQLYAWVDAAVLAATGAYTDLTFRIPTVLATLATGVFVYLLGRRWYGRRTGLLAACLWIAPHHMNKMAYIATTDMLLALSVAAAIFCADRLLFHRAPRGRRGRWVVALWATMILGGMTKGWGAVNLVLVGAMLAPATAILPGFGALRRVDGLGRKTMLTVRLVGRRWRRAMRATRFGWGMLAMIAAIAPVWIGMFAQGGAEFRDIVYFEFVQRVTGTGTNPPHSASAPAAAHFLYYLLPVTPFLIAAVGLVRPRRWLAAGSPTALPLCWILAVVVPFSLTHGFRSDYLLPCYAAAALAGAWAVGEIARRGPAGGGGVSFLRHFLAATALVMATLLVLLPPLYALYGRLPDWLTKTLREPAWDMMRRATLPIALALIPLGAAAFALTVRWSLRWRVWRLAGLVVLLAPGVMFLDRHFIDRQAVTGDGDRMVRFARAAGRDIGDAPYAGLHIDKLATELYLGRFALDVTDARVLRRRLGPEQLAELGKPGNPRTRSRAATRLLNRSDVRWLITCDLGLVAHGAAERDEQAPYALGSGDATVRYRTRPERLGEVVVRTDRPIEENDWGRMYLIRLDRPLADVAAHAVAARDLAD
ncbi:MAG: glycosyltransferase family 39 protein [Phycisphaerae bacterium]|nr:glycosyltransferase family 39 protein [Phycisphaerae bacterium]